MTIFFRMTVWIHATDFGDTTLDQRPWPSHHEPEPANCQGPQGLKSSSLLAPGGTAEAVPFPKPFLIGQDEFQGDVGLKLGGTFVLAIRFVAPLANGIGSSGGQERVSAEGAS
jgi:hypothetical protein